MEPIAPLPSHAPGRLPPWPRPMGLAVTALVVCLTGWAVKAGTDALPGLLPEEVLPLVFLAAVLVPAVAFGFWCGLLAALLAFGVLNFLFTEPLYTFHVTHVTDFVALGEFLLVAALSGFLAGRLHDRAEAARLRAEALEVLAALSAALAAAGSRDEALSAVLPPLGRLCRGRALAVTPEGVLGGEVLDAATGAAAQRALRSGQVQPASAPGWEGSRLTFLPLAEGLLLGHAPVLGHEGPQQERAIAALVEQTRAALQRLDLAARVKEERLRAEAEAARSAVLTSLSHDLRTPLATILGSASALRELDLPEAARTDLLTAIVEEAGRLNAHVTNLMHLSRLELAAPMRRDWVDLGDLAQAAVARARRAHSGREVEVVVTELPMIQSDSGLIEQASFNLIDNALAHGRAPVRVRAHETAGRLCITVTDAGPGLPAPLALWLEGPDLRPARGQPGLGLAVAKGIARHLGGRLDRTPDGLTFSLPL